MKECPVCHARLDDAVKFCPACGTGFAQAQGAGQNPTTNSNPYAYAAPADPYDHTAEFDPKDVSDNKVYAMLPYLVGVIGVIVALLAAKESKYLAFHIRQSIKLTVTEILVAIATALLCWTIIVPIAGGICFLILVVLRIIAFFQICGGKSKEPAIVRGLSFLR